MSLTVGVLEMRPSFVGPPVTLRYGKFVEARDGQERGPYLQVGEIQLPIDLLKPGAPVLDVPLVLLNRPHEGTLENVINVKGGDDVRELRGIVDAGETRLGVGSFVVVNTPSLFLLKLTPDQSQRTRLMKVVKQEIGKYSAAALLSLFDGETLLGMVGVAPRGAYRLSLTS